MLAEKARYRSLHHDRSFWVLHGVIPGLMMLCGLALIHQLDLDRQLAGYFYRWEGWQWALRNDWWLEQGVHRGGRLMTLFFLLVLVAALLLGWSQPAWRRVSAYLLSAVLTSLLVVNLVKAISGAPCPWSLQEFGGSLDPASWFDGFTGERGCFPAGHASAGYAWVALYFMARLHAPRWRHPVLLFCLSLGGVFGFSQQLRGAHFLSHDVVTLAVCWFVALGLYLLYFGHHKPRPDQVMTLASG